MTFIASHHVTKDDKPVTIIHRDLQSWWVQVGTCTKKEPLLDVLTSFVHHGGLFQKKSLLYTKTSLAYEVSDHTYGVESWSWICNRGNLSPRVVDLISIPLLHSIA